MSQTTTENSAPISRTIHRRVTKATDIEIHVSTLETSGGSFVDIREYVVSLEQYGRGITFPATHENVQSVLNGLEDVDAVDGS